MSNLDKRKALKQYCWKTKCQECKIYRSGQGCLAVDFMSPEMVNEAYNKIMEDEQMVKKNEKIDFQPDLEADMKSAPEKDPVEVEYTDADLIRGWFLAAIETDGEIMNDAFANHEYGLCFEAQRAMRENYFAIREMERSEREETCRPVCAY